MLSVKISVFCFLQGGEGVSLFISNRQYIKDTHEESAYVPSLFESSSVRVQHRIFRREHELGHVLLDSFEVQNHTTEPLAYPLPPDGCTMLVFFLGRTEAQGYFRGVAATIEYLTIPPHSAAFCLRLRPGSATAIAPAPVSDISDRLTPLDMFFRGVSELLTQLRHGESFHERNVLLQRYLTAREVGAYNPMALVSRCVEEIEKSQGNLRIQELAKTVGCSERYLNRVFQSHAGLSPKLFCELVQLQFCTKYIAAEQPKSLLDAAVDYGYFDQAHMNRAFRKFLNCTARDVRQYGRKRMTENG